MLERARRTRQANRTYELATYDAEIRSLIEALHSSDGVVRRNARRSLAKIGQPAIGSLMNVLADPDENVRWGAAKALGQIRDPSTAEALVGVLEDDSFAVRWLAREGLIALGRRAILPLLRALALRSSSVWLREGAHHVLRGLKSQRLRSQMEPVVAALDGPAPVPDVARAAETIVSRIEKRLRSAA